MRREGSRGGIRDGLKVEGCTYTMKVRMDSRGGDGDLKADLGTGGKTKRGGRGGRKRWDGDVIVVALSSSAMQRVRALHLSLSLSTGAWLLIASDTSVTSHRWQQSRFEAGQGSNINFPIDA